MEEALNRIKAAEDKNKQLAESLNNELKNYEAKRQQELQQLAESYQKEQKEALLKIEKQLKEKLLQKKQTFEKDQLQTDKENQATYEKNKGRMIDYILKKVREDNGS